MESERGGVYRDEIIGGISGMYICLWVFPILERKEKDGLVSCNTSLMPPFPMGSGLWEENDHNGVHCALFGVIEGSVHPSMCPL